MVESSPRLAFWSRPDLGLEVVAAAGVDTGYATHIHIATYTVGHVRRGKVCVCQGGEERHLRRGGVFVVGPYQPHSLKAEGSYELLTVSLDKRLPGSRRRVREVARYLHRLAAEGALRSAEAKRLAGELASLPPWTGQDGEDALERLKARLEAAPDQPLSLADMARMAGLDEFLLIRRFRRRYGLTPHRFLVQNRLRLARRELAGSLPLTQVALRAGFYDQSHFNREFRGAAALSPKQYRAAIRALNKGRA